MDFASSPRRLQRQVHYPKLCFGFGVRSRSRGILTLRCRAPPIERASPARGGGGEIRTHEAFRPSGFQDRRDQPLCHPSGFSDAYFRITSAEGKVGLKKRRGTARTPKRKHPATPENHGHILECGSALPLLAPINSRQRKMFV